MLSTRLRVCFIVISILLAIGLLAFFHRNSRTPQNEPGDIQEGQIDALGSDSIPVCLITGHEPFDILDKNPSWETAKALEGEVIAGHRIVAVELPVVYDEIAVPLEAAIERHRPQMVIAFGVGWSGFEVETVARNGYNPSRYKDNKDRTPPREKIDPNGRDQFATELPAEEIARLLKAEGIGARTSDDAGGYLCNETFYRLMNLDPQGLGKSIRIRGFVHTPNLGDQNPEGGSYSADLFRRAYVLIIQQAAKHLEANSRADAGRPR